MDLLQKVSIIRVLTLLLDFMHDSFQIIDDIDFNLARDNLLYLDYGFWIIFLGFIMYKLRFLPRCYLRLGSLLDKFREEL